MDNKCIIDNWSLEQAGIMLDNSTDTFLPNDDSFQNGLGGLSNYINALLLYDNPGYLKNGYEKGWRSFEWFDRNTSLFFNPIDSSNTKIIWDSPSSYSNKGIENYLITSQLFNSDLFISPERSFLLSKQKKPIINDNFITTLKKIDNLILDKKDESWYNNVRIGVNDNFKFPSLTQYVFSQASNKDDLLTVIMQIKTDGKIKRIKEKINEITSTTKSSIKFQKEIENIISDSFGFKSNREKSWSIKISVLFLGLSKSINPSFFNRKEHLLFLKDIIGLRTENMNLSNDIERIFKRKINLSSK